MCGRGDQHNTASNTTRMQNGTTNKIHGHFGTVNAITWCSSRMIGFTTSLLPFLDGELSTSKTPPLCLCHSSQLRSHACCWQCMKKGDVLSLNSEQRTIYYNSKWCTITVVKLNRLREGETSMRVEPANTVWSQGNQHISCPLFLYGELGEIKESPNQ